MTWTWKLLVNPSASKFSSRLNSILFTVQGELAEARWILQELSPRPRLQKARTRTRKTEGATLLTSSPYENYLEDKQQLKRECKETTKTGPTKKKATKQRCKLNSRSHSCWSAGDNTACTICSMNPAPHDDCRQCRGWYHESCGPDDTDICYQCENIYNEYYSQL